MKIAFTTKGENWDSQMDSRFGRAEMFLIYDEATETLEKLVNDEAEAMEHGVGPQTTKKMLEAGAEVIITGNGAGQKALEVLKSFDLKMYVGAGEMSVKDAYDAYKAGKLKSQF